MDLRTEPNEAFHAVETRGTHSCRSQVRKGELNDKRKRVLRAIANALTGCHGKLIDPPGLELRLECRSYELGWILWSFGRRTDLTEIQYHPDLL